MVRFKAAIVLFTFSALLGCSAQTERPEEQQEASPAKEKKEQRPSSMPTFTYRPGGGLMIEGR